MPFAQVHYPFENADWFEHHFPGDFIVEYIGQTRGWFYTLHVLATALFDRPAFEHVRQPRHRARRRRPEDVQVAAQLPRRPRGASTATAPTRCAGSSCRSPILRGGNLDRHRAGHPRRRPAGAACRCGTAGTSSRLYANAAGGTGTRRRRRTDSTDVLDRYLLAKTARPRRDGARGSSTTTTIAGACDATRELPRRADQLVRPALPRAVLGTGGTTRRRRRPSTPSTRCWRSPAGWRRRCCR